MLTEDIKTISYLKAHSAQLFNQIAKSRRPVILTQKGSPKAVLISTETYKEMHEAAGILKLASIGENEIKSKKIIKQTDLFDRIEKKLKKA